MKTIVIYLFIAISLSMPLATSFAALSEPHADWNAYILIFFRYLLYCGAPSVVVFAWIRNRQLFVERIALQAFSALSVTLFVYSCFLFFVLFPSCPDFYFVRASPVLAIPIIVNDPTKFIHISNFIILSLGVCVFIALHKRAYKKCSCGYSLAGLPNTSAVGVQCPECGRMWNAAVSTSGPELWIQKEGIQK
jgi:hypothetical protein